MLAEYLPFFKDIPMPAEKTKAFIIGRSAGQIEVTGVDELKVQLEKIRATS